MAYRSSAFMKLRVPLWRCSSLVYMLKRMGAGHFPVANRSSVSSICYAHYSIPHKTSYWTAYSVLLYIEGCLELCCRVSLLGLYGSLCRKQQIEGCTGDHVSLVTIFSVLGQFQQLAGV